jgi:hypothetical protein
MKPFKQNGDPFEEGLNWVWKIEYEEDGQSIKFTHMASEDNLYIERGKVILTKEYPASSFKIVKMTGNNDKGVNESHIV